MHITVLYVSRNPILVHISRYICDMNSKLKMVPLNYIFKGISFIGLQVCKPISLISYSIMGSLTFSKAKCLLGVFNKDARKMYLSSVDIIFLAQY